jgi:flavorubredoxin
MTGVREDAVAASGIVELVPDRVFRIGGAIELDGRVSWAPTDARGLQPLNCYLVIENDEALLIDTGPPCHRHNVVAQLRELIPHTATLSIFLTRPEYACVGNLGPISIEMPVERVMVGSHKLVIGGFAMLEKLVVEQWSVHIPEVLPISPGDAISLAGSELLDVISAPLRSLNNTTWVYDRTSSVLFSSDTFGQTAMASGDSLVMRAAADLPLFESFRGHLLAKFDWLADARSCPIAQEITEILEKRKVAVLAPSQGRIVAGSDTVQTLLALLQRVLCEDVTARG